MNTNPTQGQGSGCKKIAALPAKSVLNRRKMQPVVSSTPPNSFPEDRTSPSWGSNLLLVKHGCDETHNSENVSANNIGLCENLDAIEEVVMEFQKVTVNKKSIRTRHQKVIEVPFTDRYDTDESIEEEDSNEDTSREEEIKNDSRAAICLQQQLQEYRLKQKMRRWALENNTTSPAVAGIPVTTPKSSPIPRRPQKDTLTLENSPAPEKIKETGGKQINSQPVEDSDEEYREWETRFKQIQRSLEQSVKDIESRKASRTK